MKILKSKIYDLVNTFVSFLQTKLDSVCKNSFLLSNINFFILSSIILLFIVSVFETNNYTGVFAIIVPLLVILKVLITKGEKIELEINNFYLILYLLICLISNFTSSMPFESFYGFSKTLLYFAFYFALCQFLKNNKRYIFIILSAIGILVSFESIIGLLQNFAKVSNISGWQDNSYLNPEDILTRVYGTLKPYNPNLFAGWLIASIPSLMGVSALLLNKKKFILSLICTVFVIVSIFCLFFTGCRGAYLALFTIILGLVFVLFQINKKCKIIAILISALGTMFVVLHHGIFQRIMSIFLLRGDSSTSFRINVYNSAVQMLQDNPIFGIGVGNKVFREIYGLYMLSGFDALSCYSVFLEMAVESGIFSLLAFLMFLVSTLSCALKKFCNTQNIEDKIILFTAFISVLAVMVHGLTDTIYFRPQVQFIFWTMTAIITIVTSKEN